jgi:two-component SAPR family response regulator
MRVLRLAASYLGSSLRLAELQETQATALAPLATEREPALRQGARLTDALSPACEPTDGQHVYALGPLRVERNGELIRRWGGQKAGSRQAEAIFAMLFDRGERGAAKDEIIEIVWPDVDLDRADVAFHRTMLGLRSTLGARRGGDEPISFFNDRYLLNPALIAWSDVRELDRLLNDARSASEFDALRSLEQARALYRGDYMDDVPYFGDSAAVEERRDAYRRQMHAVVLELADRYDARGEALAASASRQEAAALAAGIRGLEPSAIPPAHASG